MKKEYPIFPHHNAYPELAEVLSQAFHTYFVTDKVSGKACLPYQWDRQFIGKVVPECLYLITAMIYNFAKCDQTANSLTVGRYFFTRVFWKTATTHEFIFINGSCIIPTV
uniref:DDE_Tnp_1_7 domain-containing protein n=1 Tax=Steinernema glaseri TaxID=37863 RepID=A0A1I8AG21_9BILA